MYLSNSGFRSFPLSNRTQTETEIEKLDQTKKQQQSNEQIEKTVKFSPESILSPIKPAVSSNSEINYLANKSYNKAYSAYSADQFELIDNPPPRSYAAAVKPFVTNLLKSPEELRAAGLSRNRKSHTETSRSIIPWDPKTNPQSDSFYYEPDCNPLDISHSGLRISKCDNGIFIVSVDENTVASAAGFLAGDELLFAHNRDIKETQDFICVINKIPGSIEVRIKRNGETMKIILARSSRRDGY